MSKVLYLVVAAVAAVAALLLVSGLVLPRNWKVQDSVVIHATPQQIHEHVDRISAWSEWAYFEHPDATLEVSYSGPERGAGARRSYVGQRAGSGWTQIVRSDVEQGVWFESAVGSQERNGHGSISYEAKAGSTVVTWTDEGELPFITGGFLRDSVQRGLRDHLERGLTRLKDIAEGRPASRD